MKEMTNKLQIALKNGINSQINDNYRLIDFMNKLLLQSLSYTNSIDKMIAFRNSKLDFTINENNDVHRSYNKSANSFLNECIGNADFQMSGKVKWWTYFVPEKQQWTGPIKSIATRLDYSKEVCLYLPEIK